MTRYLYEKLYSDTYSGQYGYTGGGFGQEGRPTSRDGVGVVSAGLSVMLLGQELLPVPAMRVLSLQWSSISFSS